MISRLLGANPLTCDSKNARVRDKLGIADGSPGSGRYVEGSENGVDPEIAKKYTDKLVGVKSSSGIEIKGISDHAIKRAVQRGITEDIACDLTANAPITYPGNTKGTMCQQKNGFRVVINKNTGNIVTFVDLEEGD